MYQIANPVTELVMEEAASTRGRREFLPWGWLVVRNSVPD